MLECMLQKGQRPELHERAQEGVRGFVGIFITSLCDEELV
jgi:hypothetical protein